MSHQVNSKEFAAADMEKSVVEMYDATYGRWSCNVEGSRIKSGSLKPSRGSTPFTMKGGK